MSATEADRTCPRCGGRGWLVEADGRVGRARPCDCRAHQAVPRLLAAAGIPSLYRRCTLDGFNTAGATPGARDQLVEAKAVCQRYVESFVGEDGRFTTSGLLLAGPPGVGKTHLAVAVLAELIGRYRVRGLFTDFTALVHRIQSTFDPSSEDSKHEVLDPVMGAEVLVLDELGAQKPTDWVKDTLYLILNTRYTRQLPTLFTTNLLLRPARPAIGSLDAAGTAELPRRHELLERRIPPGLVSRLYEMARVVEIQASDFRLEVKAAQPR